MNFLSLIESNISSLRRGQKRPPQDDRKRSSDFGNNDQPGGKRRGQPPSGEPKTVFSRLSARVPSNPDDSADEDDSAIKVVVKKKLPIFFFHFSSIGTKINQIIHFCINRTRN